MLAKKLPDIYSFNDFRSYLTEAGRYLSVKSRNVMSESEWAKQLGYRSRRTVGMVLEGKRAPSHELLERLSKRLGHDERAHRYLQILARIERSRGNEEEEKSLHFKLHALRPMALPREVLPASKIRYLSHWYHFAIKQMIRGSEFNPDPIVIARRLGNKVTAFQVKRSLQQMETLGVIEKISDAKGYRVSVDSVTTTEDVPTDAIRLHHHEQLIQAKEALYEKTVAEREFYSLTLGFDPAQMLEAKRFIRTFMDEFDRRFCAPNANEVHQCNIQFFPHTDGGKK